MIPVPELPVRNESEARWPLAVHIVCERLCQSIGNSQNTSPSELFANKLYSRLASGERAARIPVRIWGNQKSSGDRRLPSRIPLEHASKNVIVVLVDQIFFERRAEWDSCIRTVVDEAKPESDIVLPVAIHADAARVAKAFSDVNHIIAQNPAAVADDERVFQAVYTALLRLLAPELPRVFLCHAKADGAVIAKKVRQYLYEQTQLSCFFDMHDIPHGHGVKGSIEAAIDQSVVLAIWTDRLLDSPWCQFEIIEARRQQRPMLVLDALATKTSRLFPFLGNMPVVRWKKDPGFVVSAMLLEVIRTYHLELIFRSLARQEQIVPTFGLHPPDLLDSNLQSSGLADTHERAVSSPQGQELFVYPDPPLKPGELEVLGQVLPGKWHLSLVEWQALRAAGGLRCKWDFKTDQRPNPLRGLRIGISVSSSDTWADLGLTARHQEDLAFDLALQLILLGAKVVWGGDLRPDGFGSQLKWIVQTYQHPTHPPQDHVAMVAPFSLVPGRSLDAQAVGARRLFAEVQVMYCPVRWEPSKPNPAAESIEGKAITALALSVMRAELANDCHARILLGGGLLTFQGLYPGIAEEAYETVKRRRPLYVIGGYGGAALAIYEAISGSHLSGRETLLRSSLDVGAAACKDVRRLHAQYVEQAGRSELMFNPEALVDSFSSLGLEGLSNTNGLSTAENERLSESQDIHEILQLIVKGFIRVGGRQT